LLNCARLNEWHDRGDLVLVCPEVAGGLPVPRVAAEIRGNNGGEGVYQGTARVINRDNDDVTSHFIKGARPALELTQIHNIKVAILKARSPSCGFGEIYDGTFSKNKINGLGVTAYLLAQHGIQIFNESEVEQALDFALNFQTL
jgi:uncharacterized protein YbbK (DUF523 family)